jgi:hypothetical protein
MQVRSVLQLPETLPGDVALARRFGDISKREIGGAAGKLSIAIHGRSSRALVARGTENLG